VFTPDQITAIAPDAASLKAGRDLGSPRKWQSLGGDDVVLWGLAMGSGKEPYQTRVALGDFATKCSCPSRKFPCKHALGLMFIAAADAGALTEKARPAWVVEWVEARAAREEKLNVRAVEKASAPVDEKGAAKRRQQREARVADGVSLLRQTLLDLVREGLASPTARAASTWENLARRMVDCQAPGLAGNLRYISDTVLRSPDVDSELPLELGRIYLLAHVVAESGDHPDAGLRAELSAQMGGRSSFPDSEVEGVEDEWFVAGRRVEERDRLITSATVLHGLKSGRWARVLRFAALPQTIVEPWPIGSTVKTTLNFHPGLLPMRATPVHDGHAMMGSIPLVGERAFGQLLQRFADTLAANPFARSIPFLMELAPVGVGFLADSADDRLPWNAQGDSALRVDCICGGLPALMCGEWDGRAIRLLAIRDGDFWFPLTSQQA
jgi:hypothetical protein